MQYPSNWVPLLVSENDPTPATFNLELFEERNLLASNTYDHVEISIRRNDAGDYSVPAPLQIYALHRVHGIVGPFEFAGSALSAATTDPANERWIRAWTHLPECIAYFAKAPSPITGPMYVDLQIRTVDQGRAV
jgi:hypothetical protein